MKKMKKNKIIYWTATALFAFMMFGSAIPDVMSSEVAIKGMHEGLGYPVYLVPFIGIAKMLGVIAILIPGFARIKEWAYAGFAIEFLSASISNMVVDGLTFNVIVPLLVMAVLLLSYFSFHKKLKLTNVVPGIS